MRVPRAIAGAVVVAALAGCAATPAERPAPTATHSREVASASRCLADHSPWTVDLEEAYRAWYDAAGATRELRSGAVSGTAELSFTRGDATTWTFTADRVSFELFFADGTRESTTFARESSGGYTLPEPGELLQLDTVRVVAAATTAGTTTSDGATSPGTSIAAPHFPWDAEPGTVLGFACTEHRLLVSAPGETPDTWSLIPG